MGNKKRNVAAPRSKAAPAAGEGGAASESVISSVQAEQNLGSSSSLEQRKQQSKAVIEASVAESDASSYSGVKLECERALTALDRGNHTKALRIMKETCAKHENSVHLALIHRVQGTAHLEDLAKKEATEKSDAAGEAVLAELALDSKKGIPGRSDSLTHPHEKMKNKKKNKKNRKTKDLKATGSNERMPRYETADGSLSPVASNVDDAGSKIVESVSVDTLKQQEEELRRRIELEAEERKLEETLEYQRRIEDEAKQKHLAEQKKTTGTIPHKHSNSDQNVHEQLEDYKQAHLEDLAKKEATEKSVAAGEAVLAELALDSKKGIAGRSDSLTHPHEKMKNKKKNKKNRKTKDLKATGSNERMPRYETADGSSSPVASNADDAGSKIVESVSVDTLKQQEEELRWRIEFEAEERKLEETLEYQRRIEDEAKQKHLAEQKKTTGTIPHKHSNSDQNIHEQLKDHKQGPVIQKNKSPKVLESVPVNTDRAAEGIGNMHGHHQTKCKQGLPDGEEIHENGASYSDRRTGRNGRRQKSSTKLLDAKCQALLSEKQNVEVAETIVKDSPDGDSSLPDGEEIHENGASYSDRRTGRKGRHQKSSTKLLDAKYQALSSDKQNIEVAETIVKDSPDGDSNTFHSHPKLPLLSSSSQRMPSEVDDLDASLNEVTLQPVDGADIYGTGLKNEIEEYNCFLNVIIQSLWHLRWFRDEFLGRSRSAHVHVGDPCATCALHDIFTALSTASTDMRREAVAPTSLRVALSNLYPDSNFFLEAQMNDASEVLGVIFDCLHRSFTSGLDVSDTKSVESNCASSWDCRNPACIAHSLFGMDIFERMNCYNCGLESRHLKYTSFFHNIDASALRTTKEICAECSFDELLNLVEVNHQLACDLEAGGCGELNHIHHILSSPPHVFTTVLGWQNTCESAEDITATLAALATEVDIGVLYRGLDPQNKHSLVSVVCYYGQHYHCFAYIHEHEQWVMYDDKTVKVIGSWGDVLTICKRGRLQPQVLFFEAVN